jgi:CDGSH-type Zn-finger protein
MALDRRPAGRHEDAPPVTVTICVDGPLLMRGPFTLLTQEGQPVEAGRRTVALCRCGRSGTKPFCDGSHKLAGFRAPSAAENQVEARSRKEREERKEDAPRRQRSRRRAANN